MTKKELKAKIAELETRVDVYRRSLESAQERLAQIRDIADPPSLTTNTFKILTSPNWRSA